MNRAFRNAERVTVTDGEDKGKTGVVVRLRRCDDGAWVRLDSEPAHPRFPLLDAPFGKPDPRHFDILLYPEQCEVAKAGA